MNIASLQPLTFPKFVYYSNTSLIIILIWFYSKEMSDSVSCKAFFYIYIREKYFIDYVILTYNHLMFVTSAV